MEPLCIIINQSLISGIYPERLQIAKVVPLCKKDDKTKTDNYLSISPLPSISKLFEKVVYNQMFWLFTKTSFPTIANMASELLIQRNSPLMN